MITGALVVEKILAYLNGRLTETELVHWAEDAFVALSESDDEAPDEETIIEVLTYLGAGDTPDFPLTWSVLSDALAKLGAKVRVVAA